MKLWNYIVIMTGIGIIMALAGLDVAGFSTLFNTIGLDINITQGISDFRIQSTLWNFIFGTTGLLVVLGASTAVGIGTFIYTKDKAFLMIPIITNVFFYWISVLISIINYSKSYPVFGTVLGIIFIPLTVGFIMSCIEWFYGIE